jgi:hypothetical protein
MDEVCASDEPVQQPSRTQGKHTLEPSSVRHCVEANPTVVGYTLDLLLDALTAITC